MTDFKDEATKKLHKDFLEDIRKLCEKYRCDISLEDEGEPSSFYVEVYFRSEYNQDGSSKRDCSFLKLPNYINQNTRI